MSDEYARAELDGGLLVLTEEIPAYCAVAIAGLGGLPDTILSRCVIIAMRRRLLKAAKDLERGIEPVAANSPAAYRMRGVDVLLPKETPFDQGAHELMEVTI